MSGGAEQKETEQTEGSSLRIEIASHRAWWKTDERLASPTTGLFCVI